MGDSIELTNPCWDVFAPSLRDDSVSQYEYSEYREKNVNVEGLTTYELINQDLDLFLLPSESYIQVKCTIHSDLAGANTITGGDLAFVNSGYSLFDKAFYYMNDQAIENLDYVGMLTHVKHLCGASKESEQSLQQQGLCLDRGYGGPTNNLTADCLNGAGPAVRAPATLIYALNAGSINIAAAGQANGDQVNFYINGNLIRIEGIERNTGVATLRNFIQTAQPAIAIANGTANTHYRFFDSITGKEVMFMINGHLVTFTSPAGAAAIVPVTLDGYVIVDNDLVSACYKEEVSYFNYCRGVPISNSGFQKRKHSQFLTGISQSPAAFNYGKQFSLWLPLWKLFPIFQYNQHVFRGVKHTIRLYKQQLLQDVVLHSGNTVDVQNVKIKYISWWVPTLKPSLSVGLQLDKQLSGGATKTLAWSGCQMFKSNVYEAATTSGSYRITSTAHRPSRVVAFFQTTDRYVSQTKNPRLFDSLVVGAASGVSRAHVRVGSQQYPRDEYQCTFVPRANSNAEDLGRIYAMYLSICGFEKDQERGAPISYEEFRDLYPMFVFDLSAQDQQIWMNVTSLDVEFRWTLAANAPSQFIVWCYVEYQREITLTGINSRMAVKL